MLKRRLNTYKKIAKSSESTRQTEARVLTQGAAKLNKCLDTLDDQGMHRALYDALIYNQKIWTIFQSELSREDNQQPLEVRKNLLTLGAFIHKQIRSALANPSQEKLNSIININMTIAKGLAISPKSNSINWDETLS
jgi:flagellar biosynthesis activator protein FlaF